MWEKNQKERMTKTAYLKSLAALYRVGNIADHESNPNTWTKPVMAAIACNPIDSLIDGLLANGIISEYEKQYFYDVMVMGA